MLILVWLSLFNPVVVLGALAGYVKIFELLGALRKRNHFNRITKDLGKFIKKQNEEVYGKFKDHQGKEREMEIQFDPEGLWLKFVFKEDGLMFEHIISERRKHLYKREHFFSNDP